MADGWMCPGCGRAWAPHVDQCRKCEGGAGAAVGPTFRELWETHYAPWAQRHQAKSWLAVRRGHGAHLLAHFGDMVWSAIKHTDVDAYCDKRLGELGKVSGKKIQPATVNNEIASAKRCVNHCLEMRPPAINGKCPFDKYPELAVKKVRQFHLPEGDFIKLLEHSRPLLRLMLVFSFETGMRRDEFRCLEWAEVDLARQVVHLPAERTKSRKARDVPLSDVAISVLRAVPKFARSTYVFENPKGNNQPVPETTLYQWFCKAREASGVVGPKDQAIWVHTLRKSFGTIQAMSGMPIYMLMEIMGHSSADVHFEYTKMSPEYHSATRLHLNRRIGPQAAPAAPKAEPVESPLLAYVRKE